MKNSKRISIVLLACLAFYSVPVQADDDADGPDEYLLRGEYNNPVYGYKIRVPEHLVAHWTAPPRPNHGVTIVLDASRSIYVDGGFDALFCGSAKAALLGEIDNEIGKNVIIKKASLGKHPAVEADYVGYDGYLNKVVELWLIDDSPILYSVHLVTDPVHEAEDTKIFRQVVASFRKTKRQ